MVTILSMLSSVAWAGVKRAVVAAIAAMALQAQAADWSSADIARQTAYTIVHVADWAQTRYIATHPEQYRERNPLLSEHPSVGQVNHYFAATLVAHYAITHFLPPAYRPIWQYGTITMQTYVVLHNRSVGIKFQW
jgi:hypothetical protein